MREDRGDLDTGVLQSLSDSGHGRANKMQIRDMQEPGESKERKNQRGSPRMWLVLG